MIDVHEIVYDSALQAIAMGEPRDEVRTALLNDYPSLHRDALDDILADAYRDALRQGIERDDIDESWHVR
jgi:uncharacterized protein (DUF433 family)